MERTTTATYRLEKFEAHGIDVAIETVEHITGHDVFVETLAHYSQYYLRYGYVSVLCFCIIFHVFII